VGAGKTLAVAGTLAVTGSATVIEFADGTASAPSITNDGDTNTGIFFPAADTIAFTGGGTESMRLNSSGNLGLGVTPSAWATPAGIDIGSFAGFGQRNDNGWAVSAHNSYFSSTGWKYKATGIAAAYYGVGSGTHQWFTAPSGTAGNAISFTQAMTLDASGNLGVGTTSPSVRLHVANSGDNVSYFERVGGSRVILYNASGDSYFGTTTNTPLRFATNDTERARLTSGGAFLVGTTTTLSTGGVTGFLTASTSAAATWPGYFENTNASPFGVGIRYATDSNATGNDFLYCVGNATLRASIRSNGGVANYSGNNVNISDRREKTDFAPAGEYLSKICAIPVQTFKYIDQSEDDPGLTLGVVAQDVQTVAPELVMESNWGTKEKPRVRLSVYQTDLQYALMKCIQEQQALITQLKARLDAANL
jgi:hypothetical protein